MDKVSQIFIPESPVRLALQARYKAIVSQPRPRPDNKRDLPSESPVRNVRPSSSYLVRSSLKALSGDLFWCFAIKDRVEKLADPLFILCTGGGMPTI